MNDQLRFAHRTDDLADANTLIDPQAIFDYLYFHVIRSPRTIYKGIYRLPLWHTATLHNGQTKTAKMLTH
jgi:asparagine synthase (glutamine-hydrolysing)